MSEMHPESIGANQLAYMVYGPSQESQVKRLAQEQFAAGLNAHAIALQRGDTRVIEETEEYLKSLFDANPWLRENFSRED